MCKPLEIYLIKKITKLGLDNRPSIKIKEESKELKKS